MPSGEALPEPRPISGFAKWLSRLIPAAVVVGVSGMIYFQEHASPWSPPMDLSFKLLDEFGLRSLSDFRGRVVVLNLWATWCQPCRAEFSALNALHDKYEREGLMIIAVSDEDAETVGRFSGLSRLKFTVGVMDSLAASTVPNVRPYTLILDRNGKVRFKMRGEKTLAELEQAVRSLL
jgi:thiol-disulfide isomerase/thioredoxin